MLLLYIPKHTCVCVCVFKQWETFATLRAKLISKKYRILEQKELYRSFCPAPSFGR